MVVCGGVWWFAVVCGGLWWIVVDCGGLSFSHTVKKPNFVIHVPVLLTVLLHPKVSTHQHYVFIWDICL